MSCTHTHHGYDLDNRNKSVTHNHEGTVYPSDHDHPDLFTVIYHDEDRHRAGPRKAEF